MNVRFPLYALLAASIPTAPIVAQDSGSTRRPSIAIEADVIAYGIKGYSGIVNLSLPNGLQFAIGSGRYDVPTFMLEGDANYEQAKWKATSTSITVARVTYRLNGPMKSGLALGGVVLNQNWRLKSETLGAETKFRPLSVGVTAGYYIHLTKHLYLYPTTAFTYNTVASGTPAVQGVSYKVSKWAPNGSLHAGWAWTF